MQPNLVPRGDYVNGQFFRVLDPNGEIQSQNPGDLDRPSISVPFSFEHTHEAVLAARRSFSSWSRLAVPQRAASIKKYRDLLKQNLEVGAQIISTETGKPLWESRIEISDSLSMIDFYIKDALEGSREIQCGDSGIVKRIPRGVAAVISQTPMPVFGPHSHFIPALLYGNTIVLKSSRFAPMIGQWISENAHDSGMPSGVFNIIHGDAEVSKRLSTHPEIDSLFFSGSFEVGGKLRRQVLGDYWKSVVLETGGKNAIVAWHDCHYERTLRDAVMAAYLTTGQRFTATSRILVHEKLFDKFLSDFHSLSKKCRVGFGLDEGDKAPFMGPLVSEPAVESYLRYQGIAVREGCEEIMRGKILERDKKGYYVSPSIHWVNQVDPRSIYQTNEIPGPNVAFYKVKELDETAEILNLPRFGLVTSVYTASRESFHNLAEQSKMGMSFWNRPTTHHSFELAMGGIRKSGNERPMGKLAYLQCTYPVSLLEFEEPFAGSYEIPAPSL